MTIEIGQNLLGAIIILCITATASVGLWRYLK